VSEHFHLKNIPTLTQATATEREREIARKSEREREKVCVCAREREEREKDRMGLKERERERDRVTGRESPGWREEMLLNAGSLIRYRRLGRGDALVWHYQH
jgi:hypothetical protein